MGNQSFSDTRSPLSLVVSQALEMVDSCNLMESKFIALHLKLTCSTLHRFSYGRILDRDLDVSHFIPLEISPPGSFVANSRVGGGTVVVHMSLTTVTRARFRLRAVT